MTSLAASEAGRNLPRWRRHGLLWLRCYLPYVLVQFVAPDATSFFQLFSAKVPAGVDTGNDNVKIFLLLLPVVLTALIMLRSVHGRLRIILNVLPSAGVGLLGTLLVVPLLPAQLSSDIINSSLWTDLQRAQNLTVGHTALVCLFLLWLQRPKSPHRAKYPKHK